MMLTSGLVDYYEVLGVRAVHKGQQAAQ